ncbi:hypothetical protein JCM11641_007628 [Rhodosporidiobolus odoratus]
MATAGVDTAFPDFDELVGPFVIGTLLVLFLQGITLYQSVIFWSACRKSREPTSYMVMVAVVNVMDIAHSIFCVNTIYVWCVQNFMNPGIIAFSPWSFTAEPVMTAIVATIVHVFYAHRIILVSENSAAGRLIALSIVILSLVQFGFGAAVTGKIIAYDREFEKFANWLWDTYFLNQVSATMAGPFERSTRTVVKVAVLVLITNGLSASVAVVATVVFGVFRNTNFHAIPQLTLSKLLTLSLLICLNARRILTELLDLPADVFHSHLKRTPGGFAAQRDPYGVASKNYARSVPGGLGAHNKSMRVPPTNGESGSPMYPVVIVRSQDGADFGTTSRAGSVAEKDARTFEDELEHSTYSRQPFVRSTSDAGVISSPASEHPYATAV